MAENPRIEELRRRVENDPASIAFAQLAEEYRRAGSCQDAIQVAQAGLARHPEYLSARVTLGRALMEIGDLDGAKLELETVLRSAPENLAAIRALAEIHQRRGEQPGTAGTPATSLGLPAPVGDVRPSAPEAPPLDLERREFNTAAEAPEDVEPPDPVLEELESWLSAIVSDRAERARG